MSSSSHRRSAHSMRGHDRDRDYDRDRDRATPSIDPITEDDYYRKATEFRKWLRDDRGQYLDELSSSDARRVFRKFVRRWNKGELDPEYYRGTVALAGAETTRYQWAFVSNLPDDEQDRIASTARAVSKAGSGSAPPPARPVGPSRDRDRDRDRPYPRDRDRDRDPADIDNDRDLAAAHRRAERRTARRDAADRAAELAPPPSTAREAMLEKRRATTDFHRSRAEARSDWTAEVPEHVALGGGGKEEFEAAKRRRDAAAERRAAARRETAEPVDDRLAAMRAKEDAAMAMFHQLAAKFKPA
ncbi:hypothetical protein AMAG_07156 [Allomyces macrogynus ATCC 38327]|uniref:Uncharacterized protein n=1 Tax=Allomyces macrogynus (strain ATCC 38327) TaxID=578462 RepID=A0A0L0SHB2_ALLM3|nr:hypothetical protein AMAG_07156 [Allomyces macrogynus ATCC 38327]|eukprot:KNE61886.1 hypothetical protein AMAG_07156 [Allomyces macrogynus ATCC 38327]